MVLDLQEPTRIGRALVNENADGDSILGLLPFERGMDELISALGLVLFIEPFVIVPFAIQESKRILMIEVSVTDRCG